MKKLYFFLATLSLGVLQVSLLDYFKIFNVKPDLLLISAVIASLIFKFPWAILLSIFAGLFKDAFSIGAFGINTLLFSLWCFLIARLTRKLSLEDDLMRIALIFLIALIHHIIIGLLFLPLGKSIALGIFMRIIIIESIYTAAVSPLIFKMLKFIHVEFES